MTSICIKAALVLSMISSPVPNVVAEPHIARVSETANVRATTWGAECPKATDDQPGMQQPKVTGFNFTGTGQRFIRVGTDGRTPVTQATEVVGCYVDLGFIEGPDPGWQIGVIGRDVTGYFWRNAAGVQWRLDLDASQKFFRTGTDAPYREIGDRFQLASNVREDCRFEGIGGAVRTGFPKVPTSVKSLGKSRNLVVVIDFPDEQSRDSASQIVQQLAPLSTIERFYELNSYRRMNMKLELFPNVVRMVKPSDTYSSINGNFFVKGQWQDQRLARDVVGLLDPQIDLSQFESLTVIVDTKNRLLSFGGAQPGIRIKTSAGYLNNTAVVSRWGLGIATGGVPGWKVVAHEMGHMLGFADFYIAGNGNTGRSPGPFDIMGNTIGTSHSFFGWHRWIQGWLDESDILCDLAGTSRSSFTLQTLMNDSGPRLLVSQISPTKLLLAEMRTDTEFDRLGLESGVLFYVLNLETASLQGPVLVQHSSEDIPSTWTNDVERYSRATLTLGQTVQVGDRVFRVSEMTPTAARIDVYSITEYEEFRKILVAIPAKPVNAVGKSLVCRQGAIRRVVTGRKPKCPLGFRLVRQL